MSKKKLTHEEFVLLAIKKLKNPKYKGLHTVFTGFNQAFREYFEGEDPVAALRSLAEQGKIVVRPAKGGALIYPAGEAEDVSTSAVLGKMGLK